MDKQRLYKEICDEYKATHKRSESWFLKNHEHLVRGGSHNLRLFDPFPFIDVESYGSKIKDLDGNIYIDFWQGHFANVLGHNPEIVTQALQDLFERGQGLETGFPGQFQSELSELILGHIPADKIRFTISGTLATMYAIMLALSYTRRHKILKIGGGWHGAQPYALKGITHYHDGLDRIESQGLPAGMENDILITQFNNIDDLEDKMKSHGEKISCFIIEPFIGAGGFIFASKAYIRKARELTQKYGVILIFDEVISGFRFTPGGIQTLYDVHPDLTVLGKAIGGGMHVSAVAGKEQIMRLCDPDTPFESRVKFDGGTFSAHPSAMLAGTIYLKHLVQNADTIYPRMGHYGEKIRAEIEKIFLRYDFQVTCTGKPVDIAAESSFAGLHFLKSDIENITSPDQVWNPQICDVEIREKIFKIAMLNEGINIFHGFGAVSAAHNDEDVQAAIDAVERIAQKWKKAGLKI